MRTEVRRFRWWDCFETTQRGVPKMWEQTLHHLVAVNNFWLVKNPHLIHSIRGCRKWATSFVLNGKTIQQVEN